MTQCVPKLAVVTQTQRMTVDAPDFLEFAK